MQGALDAAVLAAVRASSQQEAESIFNRLLAAMQTNSLGTVKWSSNSQRFTAVGSAETTLRTNFMGLFGFPNLVINTDATATSPAKPSQLKIAIGLTKGWNAKQIEFWVERLDGKKEIIGTITYTPTRFVNEGSGSVTVKPSSTLEIGSFRSLWVAFTSTDYATQKKKSFATNLPNMDHFFVDGKQLTNTEPASLEKLFPCGTTAHYSLEDTHYDEQQGEWATQDQFFDIITACDQPNEILAVLTK